MSDLLMNPNLKMQTPHEELWFYKELETYTKKAVEQYKEALVIDPAHLAARYLIATDYFNNKRYDEAIREYEMIIKQDPVHINSYHLLAKSYFKKGKFDLAGQIFKKVLSIDPKDDSAYYGLAMTYLNNDKGKEAYKILQHLESIGSSFYPVLKDKIHGGDRNDF